MFVNQIGLRYLRLKWLNPLNLTNLADLTSAINAYKKRFDIGEMFRDFKSGGDKLEDTNVSGNRLISLILIISFSSSMSTFQGQKIKRIGVQKYIAIVK
ncbi:hypothetical protein GTQ43_18995 [Nostoc sp. KVJ3]|nr:hypothetical protein [Nostoc sp. KVJ3]